MPPSPDRLTQFFSRFFMYTDFRAFEAWAPGESVRATMQVMNQGSRPRDPAQWWRVPQYEGRHLSLGWNVDCAWFPKLALIRHARGHAFALFVLKWVVARHPEPLRPAGPRRA